MNPRVLLPLLAVAVAGGLWLLLGTGGVEVPVPYDPPARESADGAPPKPVASPPAALVPGPRPRGQPPPAPPGTEGPITKTGDILVRPIPAEGVAVPDGLAFELEALGPRPSAQPLPRKQDDGTYLYAGVPIGKYRVRVYADSILDTVVPVEVAADEEQVVDASIVAGACVAFTARIGEADVESVTLRLFDGRGRPVAARMQARTPTVLTTPRLVPEITLPAGAGVVCGLKPGRYTLKGETPAGGLDEHTFDVKAGEALAVDLRFRR